MNHRPGKLPVPPHRFRDESIDASTTLIPITEGHAIGTISIPDGHSDSFDRLLLAVAQNEELVLLTGDLPRLRFAQANAIPAQSPEGG